MSDNDFEFQLNLPIPWDIPLDYRLEPIQQQKLTKSLKLLLESLSLDSIDKSLTKNQQAIACLGIVTMQSVEVEQTKTFLKTWEVQDYDNYFKINRVRSTEPAAILVQSLLVNCRAFFLLCKNNKQLDKNQIKIQKQGFISYVYLIARNFNLEI